ncbi:TetR family transcriptional regulator [Dactylosporangium fulvum]|uniref:TetR/AcrR family transcriptional regulator n=1 Tax=Dactylosporangium fulvum TaxID=53359 RepID=A0ABY5VVV1_9ACTN|nr:TetR/AcrR family transcriptional regulator [Dactylosporangium fulvum]UWP79916.1 TetR/AcrR family transcriptional regulator [Dactylosporangium fulvum]
MGRTAGRSPEDTRRALLDAAGKAIRARGIHASLDDIARHAGVSKGGLIYHFASKDELILELARDLLTSFRSDITAQLDPHDTEPGRLTRAYIRTLLAPADDETAAREAIELIAQLMTIPAVAELARAHYEQLDAELAADGLPDDVRTLVIAAADGINSAPLWGASMQYMQDPKCQQLEQRLIQLTRQPELWQQLPWDAA